MVVIRRKKNTRMRATRTNGHGGRRKRRGGGGRGGRGNAGSGKRADSKKPSYWDDERYMGKFGFVKKNIKIKVVPITIKDLERKVETWKTQNKATEQQGIFSVDLNTLGYTKLLGTGHVTKKMKIICETAAANAVEKIKEAGGEVILPK